MYSHLPKTCVTAVLVSGKQYSTTLLHCEQNPSIQHSSLSYARFTTTRVACMAGALHFSPAASERTATVCTSGLCGSKVRARLGGHYGLFRTTIACASGVFLSPLLLSSSLKALLSSVFPTFALQEARANQRRGENLFAGLRVQSVLTSTRRSGDYEHENTSARPINHIGTRTCY